MNRKTFLKQSLFALGASISFPYIFTNDVKSEIIPTVNHPNVSYKDFDWMRFPSALAFRIEIRNGKHFVASIPYIAQTWKTKIISPANVDYTKEILIKDNNEGLPKAWHIEETERFQTIYTNLELLTYAKQNMFTHIYCFVKYDDGAYVRSDGSRYGCYFIRGAKLPEWKTNNGKLQIVNV